LVQRVRVRVRVQVRNVSPVRMMAADATSDICLSACTMFSIDVRVRVRMRVRVRARARLRARLSARVRVRVMVRIMTEIDSCIPKFQLNNRWNVTTTPLACVGE